MDLRSSLRSLIKRARKRGALWVRAFDLVRPAATAEGRGQLWTMIAHRRDLHQTTPWTRRDRYPELFDLRGRLRPNAGRIFSFGCSTGEELVALRRLSLGRGRRRGNQFAQPADRDEASSGADQSMVSVAQEVGGTFGSGFRACSPSTRAAHGSRKWKSHDLSSHYPFDAVRRSGGRARRPPRTGGLLCVIQRPLSGRGRLGLWQARGGRRFAPDGAPLVRAGRPAPRRLSRERSSESG